MCACMCCVAQEDKRKDGESEREREQRMRVRNEEERYISIRFCKTELSQTPKSCNTSTDIGGEKRYAMVGGRGRGCETKC